jgi:heat shock protein HslJ
MSTGGATRAAAVSRLVSIAAAGLLAAGCTSIRTTDASLQGSQWQVVAIDGHATPRTEVYRMHFRDGQAGGRFGCNQFGGRYSITSGEMVVTDTASTLMGCPEPAASFEREGLAVLQQPMRLTWTSDRQLTLSNAAGSIALERLP